MGLTEWELKGGGSSGWKDHTRERGGVGAGGADACEGKEIDTVAISNAVEGHYR